ncbi:hypothetical protein GCM10009726_26170 [Nocardioides furvisabuli]|uniref:Uncharacterized protein n=1 Tax=Nocardioides furvisabuli TaxID=375542 RepID=A0ABN2XG80_9ACTN
MGTRSRAGAAVADGAREQASAAAARVAVAARSIMRSDIEVVLLVIGWMGGRRDTLKPDQTTGRKACVGP